MKKRMVTLCLIVLVFIITCFILFDNNNRSVDILLGDVTLDGLVNTDDYTVLQEYISGKTNLGSSALTNADVNEDNNYDSKDISMLKQMLGTSLNNDDNFKIYFISENNNHTAPDSGDCILLEKIDSNGIYHYALVDTGIASKKSDILNFIDNKFNEHKNSVNIASNEYNGSTGQTGNKYVLDFVILTHNHGDHIANLPDIIDRYKVNRLYLKDFDKDSSSYFYNNNPDPIAQIYVTSIAKIFDQNKKRNDASKNAKVIGLDSFTNGYNSTYCPTVANGVYTFNNTVDGYHYTPDIYRMLASFTSDGSWSYKLNLMCNATSNDFEGWTSSNKNINFAGTKISIYNTSDNELISGLNTTQKNKHIDECPYYPYTPDYWDKTGAQYHNNIKSNYYSKYDIYDSSHTPTFTYPYNENVRSLALLITNGNQHAIMAGDLMNDVRSGPGNTDFVYCGYEDGFANLVAKEITGSITGNISIDFVKMSHHGYWHSNTIDYLEKLKLKNAIITNNITNGSNNNVAEQALSGNTVVIAAGAAAGTKPYGDKKLSYNTANVWHTVQDTKSMVVDMGKSYTNVYPESFLDFGNITIKSKPNKTTYNVGDNLDVTGLVIAANNISGLGSSGIKAAGTTSGVIIDDFSLSPITLNTAGTQVITVTYKDKTTSFNVTVNKLEYTSLTAEITGDNIVGSTLTATPTASPTADSYTYQWWTSTSSTATSGTNISGATSSTYTVTSSEAGKYIGVTVTAKKANYTDKSATDITDATNNTTAKSKTSIAAPTNSLCKTNLTYTGSAQPITSASGTGYTLNGNSQTNAGSHTVTATLATNYIWSDKSTGTKTFSCSIGKADNPLTVTAVTGLTYNGSAQTLATKASAQGDVYYNVETALTSSNCTTSGTKWTDSAVPKGTNATTYKVYYYSPENDNYKATAGSLNVSTTIDKKNASISYGTTTINKKTDDKTFTNNLTNTGDGSVMYESSNVNVATIDNSGKVTIKGIGATTITATVSDSTNYTYETKTATYRLTVDVPPRTDYFEFKDNFINNVDNENKILNKVKANTTFNQMKENISTDGKIIFFDKDNVEIIDTNSKFRTGDIMKVELKSETIEYSISVVGDVNCDGQVNVMDILKISDTIVNKTELPILIYNAADVDINNSVNVMDIIRIANSIVNKVEL